MQEIFNYTTADEEDEAGNAEIERLLWGRFKAQFEEAQDKDFYVELMTLSYKADALKIGATLASNVEYVGIDGTLAVTQSILNLCTKRLNRYRRFMGGITYDGWGMEIEVNYYPFRTNHGYFALHKDDYFRAGKRSSEEGGVMFVCLTYLASYPVFGPEVTLDRGNGFDFAELSYPQIASLPPAFARRVAQSKEAWIDRMLLSQQVYCPIIEPYSEVMFCDTLAIHQTPATLQSAPPALVFTSHNPTSGELSDEVRDHFTNKGMRFPMNRADPRRLGPDGDQDPTVPLNRDLDRFYEQQGEDEGVAVVFFNTNKRPRSFLRLTFRAKRP